MKFFTYLQGAFVKPARNEESSDEEAPPDKGEDMESEEEKMEVDTNVRSVKEIAKLRYSEQLTRIQEEIHRKKQMPRGSEGEIFPLAFRISDPAGPHRRRECDVGLRLRWLMTQP